MNKAYKVWLRYEWSVLASSPWEAKRIFLSNYLKRATVKDIKCQQVKRS